MGLPQADSWSVVGFFILGPVLFNVCTNNLDIGLKGLLSKFVHDVKVEGADVSLKGREAVLRDLDILEKCAISNCMKFNRDK